MDDQKMLPTNDTLTSKPRKKKPSTKETAMLNAPGDNRKRFQDSRPRSSQKGQKTSRKVHINNVSPLFQQQERSASDSLPDSSTSGNEYRALRRKYLLLEEESFGLGSELKEVEDNIMALQEEKLSLLDELVVLEGLMIPQIFSLRAKDCHDLSLYSIEACVLCITRPDWKYKGQDF